MSLIHDINRFCNYFVCYILIYIQVALRIVGKQTMEREFGNLLAIKDNYPKFVITLDDYSGVSYEGILHIQLRKVLSEFN